MRTENALPILGMVGCISGKSASTTRIAASSARWRARLSHPRKCRQPASLAVVTRKLFSSVARRSTTSATYSD
jgi:hypothetical protein